MTKKNKKATSEDSMKQIQKIFRGRGTKALKTAQKAILAEKIESPEVREALSYFMNKYWLDTTRPALLSLFCEAVGGNPKITMPIAVSAVLTSGAVDIHDDIIDASKVKEAGTTVYGKFGKDIALLTGDALLFKGLTLLLQAVSQEISVEKLLAILDVTKKTFFELGDAEALELHFRKRLDTTPEEYLHVLEKKAAIVEGYARIGAILGNGSEKELEDLGRYGKILGMLVMLRDDLIDIIDVSETQHRVEKESLPLPLIYALQRPKTKTLMLPFIKKRTITKKEAEFIAKSARQAGGVKSCIRLMQSLANEACVSLNRVKHNRAELELLARATIQL